MTGIMSPEYPVRFTDVACTERVMMPAAVMVPLAPNGAPVNDSMAPAMELSRDGAGVASMPSYVQPVFDAIDRRDRPLFHFEIDRCNRWNFHFSEIV